MNEYILIIIETMYSVIEHSVSIARYKCCIKLLLFFLNIIIYFFIPFGMKINDCIHLSQFTLMCWCFTDYMGDMSMILDPHPPPPTPSTTSSLDVTVDVEEDVQQGSGVRPTEVISDIHSAPSTEPSQDATSLGSGQVLRRLLVDSGKPPGE